MEIGKLPQIVLLLVMVGILLGAGLILMDKFSYAGKTITPVNLPGEVTNYTGALISTTNTDVRTDNVVLYNYTGGLIPAGYYSITTHTEAVATINFSAGVYAPYVNQKINVTYTYGKDSEATDVLESSRDSVGSFASDWMPIIVLVIAVSVILFLVIRAFRGGMGGERK